jgi:hypothetical protein
MLKFRNLRADEIECRVQSVKSNGFVLLLYKDARCDMNILDETVGCLNWQRKHLRDNANCVVSIWNDKTLQFISKEDVGVESYTEREKGQASDSFKRACFNWGIGRELYTSPFIWINDSSFIKQTKGNKLAVYEKFKVYHIKTSEDKKIEELGIADSKGNAVYKWKHS